MWKTCRTKDQIWKERQLRRKIRYSWIMCDYFLKTFNKIVFNFWLTRTFILTWNVVLYKKYKIKSLLATCDIHSYETKRENFFTQASAVIIWHAKERWDRVLRNGFWSLETIFHSYRSHRSSVHALQELRQNNESEITFTLYHEKLLCRFRNRA
jgi:hypothetical protein